MHVERRVQDRLSKGWTAEMRRRLRHTVEVVFCAPVITVLGLGVGCGRLLDLIYVMRHNITC